MHGQVEITAVVVNDQLTGSSWLPEASRAPLTVAVYVVLAARLALGSRVAVRVAASYVVVAGHQACPPGPRSSKVIVACWTGSLKVAVGETPRATPVAPTAGVRPVTVGLVVSGVSVVKVQVTGSIWLPAASRAPLTLAV